MYPFSPGRADGYKKGRNKKRVLKLTLSLYKACPSDMYPSFLYASKNTRFNCSYYLRKSLSMPPAPANSSSGINKYSPINIKHQGFCFCQNYFNNLNANINFCKK